MKGRRGDMNSTGLPSIDSRGSSASSDDFWVQVSPSANAVRQLSTMTRKTRRHHAVLPGGKLQPLFKNHTAPPRMEGSSQRFFSNKQALPNIQNLDGGKQLVQQIMCGNYSNLPQPITNTVRIYLCSSVLDMEAERLMLREKAYPEIKKFCRNEGLDFQLVDLNYGSINGLSKLGIEEITQLYKHEITECQRLSLGPNFVALIGEEYSDCWPPVQIPQSEFDILHNQLVKANDADGAALLSEFYAEVDTNAKPPVKLLNKNKPRSPDEFSQSSVQQVLCRAAVMATEAGELEHSRTEFYSVSEIENQLNEGIFKVRDPRSKCLCYVREYGPSPKSRAGSTVSSEQDTHVSLEISKQQKQANLLHKIEKHLGINNYHEYLVKQRDEPEQEQYLHKLCKDFIADIKRLIMHNKEMLGSTRHLVSPLFQEVLHHAYICQAAAECYVGQQNLLSTVKRYLHDPRQNVNPLVLHAPPGGGKTATIATLVKQTKEWFTEESVTVVRFLGTTTQSSSVLELLRGIILQITSAYGIKPPNVNCDLSTLLQTLNFFRSLVRQVSDQYASTTPLFIYLDGLEKIFPADEAARVLWAVKELPQNVNLVLSVIPNARDFDILKQIAGVVTQPDCIVGIDELSSETAQDLVKKILDAEGRTVDNEQRRIIENVITHYKQPLIITTLARKMCKLRSGQTIERLADTEKFNLMTRLEKDNILEVDLGVLEHLFGEPTLNQILCYVAVSGGRVTETELEELMATNDDLVLALRNAGGMAQESGQIPSYVLSYIMFILSPYLTYNYAYGRMAVAWRHLVMMRSAALRYGVLFPGIDPQLITEDDTQNTLEIHDHFIKLYSRNLSNMENSADPVTPQVSCWMQELPIHMKVLAPIDGVDNFKKNVLFNLDWLLNMNKAFSTHTLLKVIADTADMFRYLKLEGVLAEDTETADVSLLYNGLHDAIRGLVHIPANHLIVEILARLSPQNLKFPYVRQLHEDAHNWVSNHSGPDWSALIPLYPCLPHPGGLLDFCMSDARHIIGVCGASANLIAVFSQKSGIDIWNIYTREKLHHFNTGKEQRKDGFLLAESGQFLLSTEYSHVNHQNELSVWSLDTGIKAAQQNFPHPFDALRLNSHDGRLIVATTMQNVLGSESKNRSFLVVDVLTREVVSVIDCKEIHQEGIHDFKILSDNRMVSLGSGKSRDLALWQNYKLSYKVDLECEAKFLLVSEEKQIAVCAAPSTGILIVLNLTDGNKHLAMEREEYRKMSDVCLSKKGEHALIATQREGVAVYSIKSGTVVKTFGEVKNEDGNAGGSGYKEFPCKLCIDPLELFLAIGYRHGEIDLYYIPTGQLIGTLPGHSAPINSLLFYSTISLLSSSDDETVKQWNLQSLIEGALGEEFDNMTSSQWDGVWQFEDNDQNEKTDKPKPVLNESNEFPGYQNKVASCMVSQNGQYVITTQEGGTIKLWDSQTGMLQKSWDSKYSDIKLMYSAYKGKLLITHYLANDGSQNLQVLNSESGEEVTIGDGMIPALCSCVLPGEDKLLTLAASSDTVATVSVIDLFQCAVVSTCKLPVKFSAGLNTQNVSLITGYVKETHPYIILKYQPRVDTSYLYTISVNVDNMQVQLLHREPTQIDMVSTGQCMVCVGHLALCGTANGQIVTWNVEDQSLEGQFKESKKQMMKSRQKQTSDSAITCLQVSADSTVLTSGDEQGNVKIWDLTSQEMMHCFTGHKGKVNTLSISTDSSLVASGSADGTICLRGLQDKTLIGSFYSYGEVMQVDICQASSSIVAVTDRENPHLVILKWK